MNWVLTAAHCLMEDEDCQSDKLFSRIVIQAGIVNTNTFSGELQEQGVGLGIDTTVFMPSFYDFIAECKAGHLRGYGRKKMFILHNMDTAV